MLLLIYLVTTLAQLWRKTTIGRECDARVFELPKDKKSMQTFIEKYDEVQEQLSTIAAMDDLLSGRAIKIRATTPFLGIHCVPKLEQTETKVLIH